VRQPCPDRSGSQPSSPAPAAPLQHPIARAASPTHRILRVGLQGATQRPGAFTGSSMSRRIVCVAAHPPGDRWALVRTAKVTVFRAAAPRQISGIGQGTLQNTTRRRRSAPWPPPRGVSAGARPQPASRRAGWAIAAGGGAAFARAVGRHHPLASYVADFRPGCGAARAGVSRCDSLLIAVAAGSGSSADDSDGGLRSSSTAGQQAAQACLQALSSKPYPEQFA